jgi:hypothetical protein
MTVETFVAGVQYDDFKGSVAADRADMGGATTFLEKRGSLRAGEFLVGIEAYVGTSTVPAGQPVTVSAKFLLAMASTAEAAFEQLRQAPLRVRTVSFELPPNDFFSLFKRFSITLSSGGELEGQEYEATEEADEAPQRQPVDAVVMSMGRSRPSPQR